ncbi:MAG: carboxypeptidase-like regulatory domain-containing protein [Vicinamibacterales bacterium]
MTFLGRTSIGAIVFILLSGAALPASQARNVAAPQPANTATVAGVVVDDNGTGAPIARAVVVLRGADVQPAMLVVADDTGRFVFGNLPAGSFVVTASKSGYLTMSYGQKTAGQGSGLPLALTAGQQFTDLRIALPRASAISGQVRDEAGQPVENAPIIVGQYRSINGEMALARAGGISQNTDDRGSYRVHGLVPGEYILCAFRPGNYLALPQNCGAGSLGQSVREISAAELQWARQQIRAAAPGGAREPLSTTAAPPPPLGPSVSYGSTFYPQSPDAAGAVPVSVGPGEERTGIDIVMLRRTVGRVEAVILGVDGQPARGARVSFSDGFGTSSRATPDGAFSASSLWPGRYVLSAVAADATATTEIVIQNGEEQHLVLQLQPAGVTTASFSGRVVFDATTLKPPSTQSAVRISLVSSPPSALHTGMVNADGTFTISRIEPGRYRVQASLGGPAPSGPSWVLKSATAGGQDASDSFFEVTAGQVVADAVVTFTDHPSELSGTLQDSLGRPAGGFYVVIFPAEKIYWRQGVRRLPPSARSATDGRYRFTNLPAGRYRLVALTDVNQNDLYDEAFLTSLLPGSIEIIIADGEKKVQDLKLGQ